MPERASHMNLNSAALGVAFDARRRQMIVSRARRALQSRAPELMIGTGEQELEKLKTGI